MCAGAGCLQVDAHLSAGAAEHAQWQQAVDLVDVALSLLTARQPRRYAGLRVRVELPPKDGAPPGAAALVHPLRPLPYPRIAYQEAWHLHAAPLRMSPASTQGRSRAGGC